MGGHDAKLTGPDLEAGIPVGDLVGETPLLGHARGEPVIVLRRNDDVLAIGATCTHYSGPLAEGLFSGDSVRCPWRSSSLRTVAIVGAGAAGESAAETLRREGYDGEILLFGADESPPVDRPNLS